ncbi:hypothetical protein D3C72_1766920 [compost metagenome]
MGEVMQHPGEIASQPRAIGLRRLGDEGTGFLVHGDGPAAGIALRTAGVDMDAGGEIVLAAHGEAGMDRGRRIERTAQSGPVTLAGQGRIVPAGLLCCRRQAEGQGDDQRLGWMRSHLFP